MSPEVPPLQPKSFSGALAGVHRVPGGAPGPSVPVVVRGEAAALVGSQLPMPEGSYLGQPWCNVLPSGGALPCTELAGAMLDTNLQFE